MAVLLLWTRPIASIHNIVNNHAGAHHTRRLGDYRDSGLVLRCGLADYFTAACDRYGSVPAHGRKFLERQTSMKSQCAVERRLLAASDTAKHMETSKVNAKGQTTVRAAVRKQAGMTVGTRLTWQAGSVSTAIAFK